MYLIEWTAVKICMTGATLIDDRAKGQEDWSDPGKEEHGASDAVDAVSEIVAGDGYGQEDQETTCKKKGENLRNIKVHGVPIVDP